MGPAMGCVFVLKGATYEELEYVREVLDDNSKKDYFDSRSGFGSVISVSSMDEANENGIGFDLSIGNVLQLSTLRKKETCSIGYLETDKKNLLYQLIMLICGNRFVDLDIEDFMQMTVPNCDFTYSECKRENSISTIKEQINKAVSGRKNEEVNVVVQLINPDLSSILGLDELDELNYKNLYYSIVTTDSEEDLCQVAIFTSK